MKFWFSCLVFFGTYIAIATEKIHKTTAALIGAALMLLVILHGPSHAQHHNHEISNTSLSEGLNLSSELIAKSKLYDELDVYARNVNFDVVFTLAGMMVLVNILSSTGLFQYIAIKCAKLGRGYPQVILVLLMFATAFLSAFLDNVTTVLLVAPVTLIVASELNVNPIPFLIAETMSSNIGGTATLIGDPPNLMIGSAANLDFMAFIINLTPFIMLIMLLYAFILFFYYRGKMKSTAESRARIMELDENAAISDPQNLKRGGIVMVLTIIGFLLHGIFDIQPCVVAMSGAALGLLVCKVNVDHALEKIEWSTLFFFIGLFIVVKGAEETGLMKRFGSLLAYTASWHPLVTVLMVVWISGIAAAIMNNVSYTAAMISVVAAFISSVEIFKNSIPLQHLMWWGLSLAVCLGGNGTLVGAAANLVVAGIAEKSGHKINFKTFLQYSLPVTFFSLVLSSIYIILRYWIFCR